MSKTFTIECAGFTGTGLKSVAAVQQWIDAMKAKHSLKGEQVRVYQFIGGVGRSVPALVGVVS